MHIFITLIYIMLSLKNNSISYRKLSDSSMKALCASVFSITTQGWTGKAHIAQNHCATCYCIFTVNTTPPTPDTHAQTQLAESCQLAVRWGFV